MLIFDEAISHAAEQVSLKDYDADGDGYVDNVHIIFAGHGEEAGASDEAIWSHEATFYMPYDIQGIKIDRYSCAPELRGNIGHGISRIGPHCHEIGHALGAMDYYDTDYETGGEYIGTGDWDVMASGSWNNDGITPADFTPYVKSVDFGWISPEILPSGNVTIMPSCEDANNYYKLESFGANDYYLLENRSKKAWGAGVPGEGLLMFHVHSDIKNQANSINARAPQKCYVVCASSSVSVPNSTPASYGKINSDGCPYPGSSNNQSFNQFSSPMAFCWDTTICDIDLNQIKCDNMGIIHLENSSDVHDTDCGEWHTLFFEGFEGQVIGIDVEPGDFLNPQWQVVTNSMFPLKRPEAPDAYAGTKSFQLSAKRSAIRISSLLQFDFQTSDSKGESLRLKMYANSWNTPIDSLNFIRVRYCTNAEDWQYEDYTVSGDSRWHQLIVNLPNDVLPKIRLEGSVCGGSVLAIDNIEVEQCKGSETANMELVSNHSSVFSIYSLSGLKQSRLQKGFNIIREKNGANRTIFVR